MTDSVKEVINRFGLPSRHEDRNDIIDALHAQVSREIQDVHDQSLMRLLCVQLFSLGVAEDTLHVWQAKACNLDTKIVIGVHLLCGAGLEETKMFLQQNGGDDAMDALDYICMCEENRGFKDFSVERVIKDEREFYNFASQTGVR